MWKRHHHHFQNIKSIFVKLDSYEKFVYKQYVDTPTSTVLTYVSRVLYVLLIASDNILLYASSILYHQQTDSRIS